MRVLAPPVATTEVVAALESLDGVSNVVVGGITHDRGLQVINADVPTYAADSAFLVLEQAGIDPDSVTMVRQSAVRPIERGRTSRWTVELRANSLVWAEAIETARENAVLSPRYALLMVTAGVIATFGIILRNPILLVGAMATSPDLLPLSAFVFLRIPKVFNLRTDPFERADITSNTYWDWMIDRAYLTYAAQFIVREFLATFAEFPPRMKAASFSIDQVLAKMEQSMNAD